ncbi:AAA domain-containing protein [Rhizobium leguminosarum]|uniref:AAA domain-containing protein n=1 Tax=Rhizobium leguminosarum TaxID=384 RepID=UPI001C980CEA|nr:AAA domain-containing protein [Rhizobium leguminosarum]MBY5436501.1 AAA family ATPase [Rhizobium leguminosarum]
MVCQIRYLSSGGIHRREIPGITELAKAYPAEWLLYTSLQCYPPNESPIELDAMVVMDDRVLLLEIKDYQGTLGANGDQWVHNNKRRFRSPVDLLSMKARKVKSFLTQAIPGFGQTYVDSRVVLTGTATKQNLPAQDQSQVWSLQEAISIAQRSARTALLQTTKLQLKRPNQFEADFERVTRNARMFGPLEAEWDGYRVIEEDFFVHPKNIWREHRAEKIRDNRYKALLRIWAFDQLPPGLNSPEKRRFVAEREQRAIGRLHALGSSLVQNGGILMPLADDKDEILTQHHELRSLNGTFTTLDRYLERGRQTLGSDERITTVGSLLGAVADLHSHDIAHRDLGVRSIWAGSPTKIALSGLMGCQLPDEDSIGDWATTLRGYSEEVPDGKAGTASSGRQRDVYALGRLAHRILSGEAVAATLPLSDAPQLSAEFPDLAKWFERSTFVEPSDRYHDGREMADEFARIVEQSHAVTIDQTLIDRHETTDLPYLVWQIASNIKQEGRCHIYRSQDAEQNDLVVKIWLGTRRGATNAVDAAISRLFDGVSRLIASPMPGVPQFVRTGLSAAGPFVVYRHEEGITLDAIDGALSNEDILHIATSIATCVQAVHAAGIFHGDISKKNILLCKVKTEIRLLDLFDLSEVGDGIIRTPSDCPPNWENLTEKQIDNYAVTKIISELFAKVEDEHITDVSTTAERELARPALDTLDPIIAALKTATERLLGSKPPKLTLSSPNTSADFFKSDGGQYYVRAARINAEIIEYSITGIDKKLMFELVRGELERLTWADESFTSLAHASQHGVPVQLDITFEHGPDGGFEELFAIIEPLVAPPSMGDADDIANDDLPPTFDVRRYWRKLLELEGALQPEVEILQDIGPAKGPIAIYEYERLGLDFDFDIGSTVEVRLPNGRKVGEVNLDQTDARTLVVENSDRRLIAGDRVNLVDRRARTSFDRRMKAVERLLDDGAAVSDLLDYFVPDGQVEATDFQEDISDDVLDRYGLNEGQRGAFRHVARYGPVGLLQGPPGTGKTHFIAALVHWLVTEKGARKILVASQSHEAVNNVIEALLDLYKKIGGARPSLLRIGSKGITEKIRPYHTTSIRERFQARFEAAFKHRISGIGSALGLRRELVIDAVEIDRKFGERVRRLSILHAGESGGARAPAAERRQRDTAIRIATEAYLSAGRQILDREVDPARLDEELDHAFEILLVRYPEVSPSDLRKARQIIELSREWTAALASPHRNFEEFLVKTRAVITATCVGVGQTKIRVDSKTYDWVIVDEAARCTPGELAVPIQVGRRVLLVGDHRQLLPMIDRAVLKRLRLEMSDASPDEFSRSDFERVFSSKYGKDYGRTLTEQYRMTPEICRLVSAVFYEPHGVLLETSAKRKADPLFEVDLATPLSKPITWVDTSSSLDSGERPAKWDKNTYWNAAEVEAVMEVLECIAKQPSLVAGLVKGSHEAPIGVICMYSAQKVKIEEAFSRRAWDAQFRKLVRIETVDSYQGKENAIVILSLVRSNGVFDQGHVRIPNRCNVSLSRAKERLIIVGAKSMWAHVPKKSPMRQVLDHIGTGGFDAVTVSAGELQNAI